MFVPFYLLRVPKEEKMMLEQFGQEYRQYISRTGRIIPYFPGKTSGRDGLS
jgi:protein-S-isoprenylcysteine O-methyltransferase Ste14